nr:2-amino-4-hydroxy-6-hydroxymethyldihydropteridine diphosphokinase [Rubellimicrobium arenae]
MVALGSNLASPRGGPAETVAAAMALLADLGRAARPSRLWKSPSWPPGGPDYVNAAAMVETALSPEEVLARLHGIEATFGRTRDLRWGARTLDLDLVAWGDAVRPDGATQALWRGLDPDRQGREAPDRLILPHPRMQDRGFVLAPLAEAAPDWRHPLIGRTVREMLGDLPPGALDGVVPL